MVKEIVEISGSSNRFYINDCKERRKIFSIFQAATDGSLAFHTYSPGERVGELDSLSAQDGQKFKISDFEMKDFELHKVNFHKSGTVTGKDKSGERAYDDYYSIKFQEIKDAITLFVFQPTTLDKYPIIMDKKEYIDLVQNQSEYLPPNVQVILSKKDYNLVKDFEGAVDSTLFVNKEILRQFDLDLCINVRKHATGEYAKQQVLASLKY